MSKRLQTPDRLFRYFKKEDWPEFTKGVIKTSDPKDFNDPFECLPEWGPAMQEMAKRNSDVDFAFTHPSAPGYLEFSKLVTPLRRQLVGEVTNKLALEMQTDLGTAFRLVCFSAQLENPLMWGHYARSHSGFVAEFDPRHTMFTSGGPYRFGPVEYSTARPVMPVKDKANVGPAIDAFFFYKSKEWEYEDEYRLAACRT